MIGELDQEDRLAYRLLGRFAEAADAVREARRKIEKTGEPSWLGTVVARVSLTMLRVRDKGFAMPDPVVSKGPNDEVGLGVLTALDALTPDERVAYVLHDMFEEPFEQVAPLIGRTPLAALQVEARARQRVASRPASDVDLDGQRDVVDAFMAGKDVLDPDVTLRSEEIWLRGSGMVAPRAAVLRATPCVEPAVVGGEAGLVSTVEGRPVALVAFTVRERKIAAIHAITDRQHVDRLFSPE
ncbi:RNA polymerase subunit sigma-70 [Lentzea sp. BCCO 10_0856]|uniref:RNA polymerase subunit sigma-70 n=1 Tax=Lentzea miocenica TaxID=3095431 RepID=A0ABU4T076_9PSEU|nr:RNA polymerase subunit sigma-70 [Lentzea sp. BCCO 10_0856]MDX8031561.1 RNA polymerase subunit sigma-70 [Lentzea sp. BCCO 10_0856]